MKIKYLKELKKIYKKKVWGKSAVLEEEIIALENKIGKKFPKVYREFIYIGGEGCPIVTLGHRFGYTEKAQKEIRERISEYNIENNFKNDDFWIAFDTDLMVAFFFYFDEGDNPPIYRIDFQYLGNKEEYERRKKYLQEEVKNGELSIEDYELNMSYHKVEEGYQYLRKDEDSFTDFIDFFIKKYYKDEKAGLIDY